MNLTPIVAIHLASALSATVIGPFALWAHKGRAQHPRLHRAFGYAWITLMIVTAVSAMFIRGYGLPNINGFTPIHLLIPALFTALFGAFRYLARKDIAGHRRVMHITCVAACIVTGGFTLLPRRFPGDLALHQWIGLQSALQTWARSHRPRNSILFLPAPAGMLH